MPNGGDLHDVGTLGETSTARGGGRVLSALWFDTSAVGRRGARDSGHACGGEVGRYVISDNEPFDAPPFGTVGLQVAGSAFGVGGDVEYKVNRWIGLDAGGSATPGSTCTSRRQPRPARVHPALLRRALLFALNVHVISTAKVDVWLVRRSAM